MAMLLCFQVNEEKIEASEAVAIDETALIAQVCSTRFAGSIVFIHKNRYPTSHNTMLSEKIIYFFYQSVYHVHIYGAGRFVMHFTK